MDLTRKIGRSVSLSASYRVMIEVNERPEIVAMDIFDADIGRSSPPRHPAAIGGAQYQDFTIF